MHFSKYTLQMNIKVYKAISDKQRPENCKNNEMHCVKYYAKLPDLHN